MKWKLAIGIVLVAASIAGMFLWETKFRDEVTMTEVLVAAKDIETDERVSAEDFESVRINPDAVIEGALTKSDVQSIAGKYAVHSIAAKQQLRKQDFEDDILPDGYRHFVIPEEWIHSKSVTVREREFLKFYALPDIDDALEENETTDGAIEEKAFWECPENYYLGAYRVAVLQPETDLEILSTVDDYFKLYETVNFFGKKLLLVLEDE